MARPMPAHQWLSQQEEALCVRINRASSIHWLRTSLCLVSRLGDGVFWYALMLSLLGWRGHAALVPVLHMVLTGAICTLLYKWLKNKTTRPRPMSAIAPFVWRRIRWIAAAFPPPYLACRGLHTDCSLLLSGSGSFAAAVHAADLAVAHRAGPALSQRCACRRRARRHHRTRLLADLVARADARSICSDNTACRRQIEERPSDVRLSDIHD